MCWVALDRACRLAQKRSLPAPLDRWRATRDTIYRLIFDEFWNERRQAFVQHRETDDLDAANLMMPLVRFISPTDPRWLSTLRAIEQDLVDDALVYRYRSCHEEASDGLEGDEGTFSICSFWYAESLSRAGRVEEARLSFEKTLSYSNHVGLFSEQLGSCGEHLGNYPQALTHLALISAAYELDRRLSPERR
jgi:GH15 family glucan-1,4-alpha-glucosidase